MIFTSEQERDICARYETGKSSWTVSKEVYCDKSTVLAVLRRNNITARHEFVKPITLKIIEMREQGYRRDHIINTLGCTHGAIDNALVYARRKGVLT